METVQEPVIARPLVRLWFKYKMFVFEDGYLVIAGFDLFAVASIILVAFNCNLRLNFRKAFVIVILYTLAIILLVYLGLFGPGLLTCSP